MRNLSEYITESIEPHVRLFCVGDALAHIEILKDAKTNDGYDFKHIFKYIKPIAKKHDLSYCNQESLIGGVDLGLIGGKYITKGFNSQPHFNSPIEFGDDLIDTGFNIFSLANNHFLDKGDEGLKNSLKYWASKDVITNGQGKNNVKIFTKNGIKFGFVSYNNICNLPPTDKEKKIINLYSDGQAKDDVEYMKKNNVDIIMVAMHWGTEYSLEYDANQKRIAQFLSTLGVNIIIGTHPHVVEPIEYINNTLVIYSLGNFVACQDGDVEKKRVGLMTSIDITKTNYKLSAGLYYIYYDNKYRNFSVIPFSKLNDNLLLDYESIEDKYKNVIQKYTNINWL